MSLLPLYMPIGLVAAGALLEYLLDQLEYRLTQRWAKRMWTTR